MVKESRVKKRKGVSWGRKENTESLTGFRGPTRTKNETVLGELVPCPNLGVRKKRPLSDNQVKGGLGANAVTLTGETRRRKARCGIKGNLGCEEEGKKYSSFGRMTP